MRFVPSGHVLPLADRRAQPDSPHGSDMDVSLRDQIASIVAASGNRRSWFWNRHASANIPVPYAQLAIGLTWYTLQTPVTSPVDLEVPWMVSPGSSTMKVNVGIVSDSSVSIQARLTTATLLDATSTVHSLPTQVERPKGAMQAMAWDQFNLSGRFGFSLFQFSHVPSLPASRCVKMTISAQSIVPYSGFTVSKKVTAYLCSLQVIDVMDKEA